MQYNENSDDQSIHLEMPPVLDDPFLCVPTHPFLLFLFDD